MATPIEQFSGSCEEDAGFVKKMAAQAREVFKTRHPEQAIRAMYFAYGALDIFALFVIDAIAEMSGLPERYWIIVGDIPSWCQSAKHADSARAALEAYCGVMDEWISTMTNVDNFGGHFPAEIPMVANYIDLLKQKVDYLRAHMLPEASSDPVDRMPGHPRE